VKHNATRCHTAQCRGLERDGRSRPYRLTVSREAEPPNPYGDEQKGRPRLRCCAGNDPTPDRRSLRYSSTYWVGIQRWRIIYFAMEDSVSLPSLKWNLSSVRHVAI